MNKREILRFLRNTKQDKLVDIKQDKAVKEAKLINDIKAKADVETQAVLIANQVQVAYDLITAWREKNGLGKQEYYNDADNCLKNKFCVPEVVSGILNKEIKESVRIPFKVLTADCSTSMSNTELAYNKLIETVKGMSSSVEITKMLESLGYDMKAAEKSLSDKGATDASKAATSIDVSLLFPIKKGGNTAS